MIHLSIYLYTNTYTYTRRETEIEKERKGGRERGGTIKKRRVNSNSNLRYFLLIYFDKREDVIMDYIQQNPHIRNFFKFQF